MERAVRVGCSGWSYDDWRGVFYPAGSQPGEWLERYARVFDTVEVDSTYYHLPREEQVRRWVRATPAGFEMLPKVPGRITHEQALRGVDGALARFLEVLEPLRAARKLGPILVQLPASFVPEKDEEALRAFLRDLPSGYRWAVELRSAKWWNERTYDALRGAGATLVWSVNQYATTPPVETSDVHYARFIGDRALTKFDRIQRDLKDEIVAWKERLERAERARAVYALVNNHFMGFGPGTSQLVQEVLGLPRADLARASRDGPQRGLGDFGGMPTPPGSADGGFPARRVDETRK